MKSGKVILSHGENEYLLYKDLREKKNRFVKENIVFFELTGSKSLTFSEIYEPFSSTSFFAAKSNVIILGLGEGNTLFPFVENLLNFIPKIQGDDCEMHIYHRGKIAKNTRIYKIIEKHGLIKEFTNPKDSEIVSVIKKSLPIDDGAAELLVQYIGGNLFALKNEIKKLSNLAEGDYKIKESDIEKYCVKIVSNTEVWGIGKRFINFLIDRSIENKAKLIEEFELHLKNNVAPMQILYSIYSYVLSFIKMKRLLKKGKGFRDCLSLGYYFVKDYFSKADSIEESSLYTTNSKLLEYEFEVKTGQIDEINGFRKLILSI